MPRSSEDPIGLDTVPAAHLERERAFLSSIKDPSFLGELHKLLWIEPHNNFGIWDPGWSCRDHAAILGALAALHEIKVDVVSGKCMYGMRRMSHPDFNAIGQDLSHPLGHSWIRLPSLGMVDVSPNLSSLTQLWGVDAGRFGGIFGGNYEPVGTGVVLYCSTARDYERAIANASYTEGVMNAVYYETNRVPFDTTSIDDPYAAIDSPLTTVLRHSFPRSIYAKAIQHLRERLIGKGRSVAGLSHRKAWKVVNEKF
jgi:hypothetical protein